MWWLFVWEALLHSWTSPFGFQTSVSQSNGRRGNTQQETRWTKLVKTNKSSEQQLDFGISKLTVGPFWRYGSQTHMHAFIRMHTLAASASDICFHSAHSHPSPSSHSLPSADWKAACQSFTLLTNCAFDWRGCVRGIENNFMLVEWSPGAGPSSIYPHSMNKSHLDLFIIVLLCFLIFYPKHTDITFKKDKSTLTHANGCFFKQLLWNHRWEGSVGSEWAEETVKCRLSPRVSLLHTYTVTADFITSMKDTFQICVCLSLLHCWWEVAAMKSIGSHLLRHIRWITVTDV